MLKVWIVVLVLPHVIFGESPISDEDFRSKFLQIQASIDHSITMKREDVTLELNKLDKVLERFQHLIEKKTEDIYSIVARSNFESNALNRSINHCIKGVRIMSKNLDLYDLHQCKNIPWAIQDKFLEAKKLSLFLPNQKTDCILKNSFDSERLHLCIDDIIFNANQKKLGIFRAIDILRETVFLDGLSCIQDNYNVLNRDLCIITCQFEACVARRCKPRQRNKWIIEEPTYITK